MIVVCACSFRKLITEDTVREMVGSLTRSGQEFMMVDDLCRMVACEKEALAKMAGNTVIACHPRAVIALFDVAGSQSGKVYNIREESVADIVCQMGLIPAGSADSKVVLPKPQGDWQPWFPAIDRSRCTACMKCVDYCLFGVYSIDGGDARVTNPVACKDNCPACARVCPEKAIIFPKYDKSPINGGLTDDDDTMGIDMRELYRNGNLYNKLAARNRNTNRLTDEMDD